jgi:hypothetical protein
VPLWYSNIWRAVDADSVKQNSWGVQFPNTDFWVTLPEKYGTSIAYFYSDRQIISSNRRFGFINRKNEVVIPIKYNRAYDFIDNFTVVKLGCKVGIIDLWGNVVVPIAYKAITQFNKGVAFAKLDDDTDILFNPKGEQIAKDDFDFVSTQTIDERSTFYPGLLRDAYTYGVEEKGSNRFFFKNGLTSVGKYCLTDIIHPKPKAKYGLIDTTGRLVVPCLYDYPIGFVDGLAHVFLNGRSGVIDEFGNWVSPEGWKIGVDIWGFGWVLAANKEGKKRFVFENKQSLILSDFDEVYVNDAVQIKPNAYEEHYKVDEDLAIVVQQNKHYGLVKGCCNVVAPIVYDSYKVVGVVYVLSKDGALSVWNWKGKQILKGNFDEVQLCSKWSNSNLLKVRQGAKWGIFKVSAGVMVQDVVYDSIFAVKNNRSDYFILVKKQGLYGACSADGKEIIACVSKMPFSIRKDGLISWIKDDRVLLIDARSGKIVKTLCYLPPNRFITQWFDVNRTQTIYALQDSIGKQLSKQYDFMEWFGDTLHTFILAKQSVYYVLLNSKGEEISDAKYYTISNFVDNLAVVSNNKGFGMIDTLGKIVVPTIYKNIDDAKYLPIFKATLNNAVFWIDAIGGLHDTLEYGKDRWRLSANRSIVRRCDGGISLVDSRNVVAKWSIAYDSYYLLNNKGFIKVSKDGYLGIIDTLFRLVVPCVYSQITELDTDLLVAVKKSKSGVINYKNKAVIPFLYQSIYPLSNSLFAVQQNNYWGVINRKGKLVLGFAYDVLYSPKNISSDTPKIGIILMQNRRYGFATEKGKVIKTCISEDIYDIF